jgi:hypothetical protein
MKQINKNKGSQIGHTKKIFKKKWSHSAASSVLFSWC